MHAPFRLNQGPAHALAPGAQGNGSSERWGCSTLPQPCQEMASEGMLSITEPLPHPLFLSLRQVQSQAGNMLPERYASAVLWTTKVREVCTPMDEPHA